MRRFRSVSLLSDSLMLVSIALSATTADAAKQYIHHALAQMGGERKIRAI
jgi:hypothetical protein